MEKIKTKIKKQFKLSRKTEQPLKLWFFILHPGLPVLKNVAVLPIIGYQLEEVLVKAGIDANGIPLTYTGQSILVQDFINNLYLGDTTVPAIREIPPVRLPSKEKLSKEQFKAGLMMSMKEFVKSKTDKALLQKVINKL